MRRLRIAAVFVQPILMWDDGDELTAGPRIDPLTINLADLADCAEKFRVETARLENELGQGGAEDAPESPE